MGFERTYQAIPADCGLIERVRDDPDLAAAFQFLPNYFAEGGAAEAGPPWPAEAELQQAVRVLLAPDAGLSGRHLYLDRRWDQVHYLLSANRRGQPGGPADAWFDVAVEGESGIAEHVSGSQGCPIRVTPPAAVNEVAAALGPVTADLLRPHYDLFAMEAAGVYKAVAGRASETDWSYLSSLIVGLRAFYLDAAAHGYAALVVTD